MSATRPLSQRFWEKVDRSGECWLWTGARDTAGYGLIGVGSGKISTAHRVSWRLATGSLPIDGVCVLHRCDVRHCVNPAHLFLGTHADNMADMAAKGRGVTPRTVGEAAPGAVVTGMSVIAMRLVYRAGGASYSTLARWFGLSDGNVSNIIRGRTWKHLPFASPLDAARIPDPRPTVKP